MERHISPRYNLNGNLIEITGPQIKETVKSPWIGNPSVTTKEQLLQNRKKSLRPDPSFDLDNDGYIGNLDLFLGKRFDLDKDGKLNATERSNAENALKTGYLDKFRFGLESVGVNAAIRTIQKRGVIIENDYSGNVLETYPMIRHESLPAITSRTQLISERKKINSTIKPFEKIFRLDVDKIKPEGYVAEPKFSTKDSIKNALKQSLRDQLGMSPLSDIKCTKIPSTEYINNPKYISQVQMNTEKKKELLENLHQKVNYNHTTREENLLEREKYLISHNLPGHEGLTIKTIKEKQRLATNEYNSKTFSNLSIGVHGKELPKFSENLNEYWKLKENYKEDPLHKSHTLLSLSKLNSAPLDKFRESDITGKEIPMSPHILKQKEITEIADKPNHVIPYGGYIPVENTESEYQIPHIKYRMSTVMGYFLESAAEMGITFLPPPEQAKIERSKTFIQENNFNSPVPEVPKTSSSALKKTTLKSAGGNILLRTTGFLQRTS